MRLICRTALGAFAALAMLPLASHPTMAQDPDFADGVSVLFTMGGQDVDVRPLPNVDGPSAYFVVIAQPANRVTWFTDRPERDAGTVSLHSFLNAWGPVGFHTDPPNAVIELVTIDGLRSVPATIANPRIRADGSLAFRATMLEAPSTLNNALSTAVFIDADDGSKEGSTWPMPKFRFVLDPESDPTDG